MKGSVASEKSKALNLVKIIQHNEIMRKKLFLAEPSFIRRCLLDGCEIFFLRESYYDSDDPTKILRLRISEIKYFYCVWYLRYKS